LSSNSASGAENHGVLPATSAKKELTAVQKAVIRWREGGPAKFAAEALGAEPDDWQWDASRILVERRKLSVRSGHGVGKSAFMAWCILWFCVCYFPCKVPATAPTGHQLDDVLWAELAKWHRVMGEKLPALAAEFEWFTGSFKLKSNPSESFAVARTSRPEKPEALQGFHSDNILFLIDEASGVSDNVFEVAEGALSTDGAFVVMAANPTRQGGYFFDSHHKMRGEWGTLHVNGETCKRVSKSYVESMAKKYGKQSSIYRVRVQGEFAAASDGVIPLELCESAKIRDVGLKKDAPIIWGVDVARFGDDSTAIAKRQGNWQLEKCREWYGKDTMQTAGIIKAEWDAAPGPRRPASINIDVIGIGAGVVDRLTELGLPVHGVNVAESAAVNAADTHYSRLRDELWFKGRDWFAALDCKLLDDDDLIGELTGPRYSILSNGDIKVESKAEMKARGVKSPNLADAWLLTFASDGAAQWSSALSYPKLGYA
jgi:phage terminase large subunit